MGQGPFLQTSPAYKAPYHGGRSARFNPSFTLLLLQVPLTRCRVRAGRTLRERFFRMMVQITNRNCCLHLCLHSITRLPVFHGKKAANSKIFHIFFRAIAYGIKKASNARRKLLAYYVFSCIQAIQNGEADPAQFPIV